MDVIQVIAFAIAGIAVGAVSSLFGIGGGTILVPLLTLGFGYSIHRAIAASLVIIVPTALIGAYRHAVSGKIRWEIAALIAVGGLLGANLGVNLSLSLPELTLRRLFVLLLLFMSVQMFFKDTKRRQTKSSSAGNLQDDSKSIEDTSTRRIWSRPDQIVLFLITGTVMGTISSLFGIGGGILVVPILTLGFKIKIHHAVAISLAVIVPTSIMGAYRHAVAGNVPWLAAFLVAIGGLLGAHWGVTLSHKLSETVLKRLFAVFLVIVALRMYF